MRNLCDNCGCDVDLGDMPDPNQIKERDAYGDIRILCIDCQNKSKKVFQFFGLEVIERMTKASGNGAVAYVPKEWMGSKLAIVRLDRGNMSKEEMRE